MKIIRLIVNYTILLTMPLWLPFITPLLWYKIYKEHRDYGIGARHFSKGTEFLFQ